MSKTTMGTKLPKKLEQKMQTVGEQIKYSTLCNLMMISCCWRKRMRWAMPYRISP